MTLSDDQKSFFGTAFGDFWPFIQAFDFDRESLFHELEEQCRQLGVYSVGPWFGRLLDFVVRFGRVRSALEFGTASGYSAIWIARGLPPGGRLITIERDARLAALARENVARAGLLDKVEVQVGEARQVIRGLQGPFDLIFVDCAHFEALELSRRALRQGGMFLCDNVSFGYLEDFDRALVKASHLETLFLPCFLKGRVPENTAISLSVKR